MDRSGIRYLIFLVVVFGVYFWAVRNIGDKYVKQYDIPLPQEPSQGMIDLHEGKHRMTDIQPREPGEPEPTVRIVEY